VRAVDDVSFVILKGETLGVVGESGCGKSTLARLLMNLIPRTAGELIFDGDVVGELGCISLRELRRNMQMVFPGQLLIAQSAPAGRGLHCVWAARPRHETVGREATGHASSSRRSDLRPICSGRAIRTSSPAARNSASTSRGRSRSVRGFSFSTKPSRRSTSPSRPRC